MEGDRLRFTAAERSDIVPWDSSRLDFTGSVSFLKMSPIRVVTDEYFLSEE